MQLMPLMDAMLLLQCHLKLVDGLTKLHIHGVSPPVVPDNLNSLFSALPALQVLQKICKAPALPADSTSMTANISIEDGKLTSRTHVVLWLPGLLAGCDCATRISIEKSSQGRHSASNVHLYKAYKPGHL